MSDTVVMATAALKEVQATFDRIDPGVADDLASELAKVRRIVCCGLGREGLMIRAFCMRLMHLGFDTHMAGDVTAPPIGDGDLLLLSSGPGDLLLTNAMIQLARRAGSRVIVVTAQPDAPDPQLADMIIHIPAQTMADDMGSQSVLPMGTGYEIALLVFLDLVAVRLRELTGQTMDQLRAKHYNLE